MTRVLSNVFALPIALALVTGCGPDYDRTEISGVSQSDLPGSVEAREIRVAVGGVLTARVTSFDTSDDGMRGEIVSEDPSVLTIERTTSTNVYAFIGARRGATRARVYADGVLVMAIPAYVVDQ